MHLLLILVIGLVVGFLAWIVGQTSQGSRFGIVGDIIVGLIGSLVGSSVSSLFGFMSFETVGSVITNTIGAVTFLWLFRTVTGNIHNTMEHKGKR